MRQIDADKLINLLEKELDMNGITDWGKGYMAAIHDAIEHVKFMPTINEQNDEAEWKYWDGWMSNHDQRIDGATCSACGYEHPTVKGSPRLLSNYCPYCGAKMKKA